MGNQPSAFDSRESPHVPHKLSKPKTGNHTSRNSLLGSRRLSQLSSYNSSSTHHNTSLPSPAQQQNQPSLAQLQSSLPSPPYQRHSVQESAVTASEFATVNHQHQPDWDYSFEEGRENLPILGRRRSFFRFKSANPEAPQERRRQERRKSGGLSRKNSAVYEPGANYYGEAITENWAVYPTSRRNSLNYDLASYEAQRLLNLAEQQQAFGEEGPTMSETFEVSEATWKSSNPHVSSAAESVNNGDLGGFSRVSSDLSMYTMPMRRQSLRQPGIATRSSPVGHGALQDARPTTPDQSRSESFLPGDDDELHLPMPPRISDPNQPRVLTPCEDDYKQIGAFKLGSLRIVNGTASPSPMASPSDKKGAKANGDDTPSKKVKQDGYFSKKLGKSAGRFLSPKVEVDEEEEPAARPLPPPKEKARVQSLAPVASRAAAVPKSPVVATVATPGASVSNGSRKHTSASSAQLSRGNNPQAKEALGGSSPLKIELPPEYLAALDFSPLLLEQPSSDELKTTSKHTAAEDQLFEDDQGSEVLLAGLEVLDVRLDPSAKPSRAPAHRPKPDPGQRGSRTVSRSDSGFVGSPTSDGASTHRSSGISALSSRLAKADSGYSSNASLRSFQSNANTNSLVGKPPIPEKDFPPKRIPSSVSSARQRGSFYVEDPKLSSPEAADLLGDGDVPLPPAPEREAPPPPVPEKDFPPLSPSASVNSSRFSRVSNSAHFALGGSQRKSRQFTTPSPIPSQTASEPLMIYQTHAAGAKSPVSQPGSSLLPSSPVSGGSLAVSPTVPAEKVKRPGMLRRLLSGSGLRSRLSRTDLGYHPNHHIEVDQPARPSRQAEHGSASEAVRRSGGFKPLTIRPTQSRDALANIFGVTARDSNPEDERPSSRKSGHNGKKIPGSLAIPERRSTTHEAFSRQQQPPRRGERRRDPPPLSHRNTVHEATFSHLLQQPRLHGSASYSNLNSDYVFADADMDQYFSPKEQSRMVAASVGRTVGSSSDVERDIHMRVAAQRKAAKDANASSRTSSMTEYYDPLSPVSSAPSPTTASHRARALSRTGSLRVPPPLRPRSLPAAQNQGENLLRKSSREAIRSFPSSAPGPEDMIFAPPSRTSSRASMRSASGNAYRSPTGEGPSRTNSISSDTGGPGWQPMHARRGSLSSYSDVGGYAAPPSRPASAAGHRTMSLRAPPSLRHRSSYDGPMNPPGAPGYFEMQKQQLAAELGRGRHVVYSTNVDPWSAGHVSYGPSPFPWDQYGQHASMQGRYPPYVPRQRRSNSQIRNRNAPYRVLHSYNSPAYRGVPIWG